MKPKKAVTSIVIIVISLITPELDKKYMTRLTWWTRFSQAKSYDYDDVSKAHKAARQNKSTASKKSNNGK